MTSLIYYLHHNEQVIKMVRFSTCMVMFYSFLYKALCDLFILSDHKLNLPYFVDITRSYQSATIV